MKLAIYKAQVGSTFGLFQFVIESTKQDAAYDIRTIAASEFNMPIAMVTVKEVTKSNRRILENMSPVKKAQTNGNYWCWVKRIS